MYGVTLNESIWVGSSTSIVESKDGVEVVTTILSKRDRLRIAIRRVAKVVKNQILNIKAEDRKTIDDHLRKVDELFKGRMVPLSSQLIKTVKNIYKRWELFDNKQKVTPVMEASRLGLINLVWGFIEYAKQNHNPEYKFDPLYILWLRNKRGETAFDLAIRKNHMEVAQLLVNNAEKKEIYHELRKKGKTLLPMLRDPKFDGSIYWWLEEERKKAHSPTSTSTSVSIDNQQQESVVNDESIDDPNSERNATQTYLDKLNHSLLNMNPNKNTILHVISKFGEAKYVNFILEKDPSLIYCHNSEGETPAYVAAREGHIDILKIMIDNIKGKNGDIEALVTRRKDKHNALHIAIQNHHNVLIFWLLEEIPQLANYINDFNESPLYLAAERRYFVIVYAILEKCKEKSFVGPSGKTTLHALAISNSANSAECIKHLLVKKHSLLYEKDENGWTPFHYAVYHNSSSSITEMLNVDNSIGYELMTEGDMSTSAIHIAARRGHWETIKVLMKIFPGSSEFIDNKGRNILHAAVESKKYELIEFIFRDESLTSLINQKDSNGDTPVHLLVASNFEMMEIVMDSRVDINVLNNKKLTPLDMASSDEKRERLIEGFAMDTKRNNKTRSLSPNISKSDSNEKESEVEDKKLKARFKIVDNLVLVATLIATATFAAGFTVPGGYRSENGKDGFKQLKEGTPFLLKKSAFQAFVVANAIAFSCSCSVLLGHIVLLIYRNSDEADETEQNYIDDKIVVMYVVTGIALLAMLIAFVTGLYVVLTPSLGLAISVCVMSLCIVMLSLKA